MKIQLGDKVRDIHTGFEGIATSKTEFINGCIQIGVVPKWKKGSPPENCEAIGIDSQSLEVITPKLKPKKRLTRISKTGGATRINVKMRGY